MTLDFMYALDAHVATVNNMGKVIKSCGRETGCVSHALWNTFTILTKDYKEFSMYSKNEEKPPILGVGWLSADKTYIKLKIGEQEYIMKKSKLTEKERPGQADYLIYPKPKPRPEPEIDFYPE